MAFLRQRISVLPPRLEGLAAVASNLSWSWNRDARELLRSIDPPLWRETRNNPIAMLREVSPSRLEHLATDPVFLFRYDQVMTWMAGDQQHDRTWFARRFPNLSTRPVAYFCAEFGLHNSVPIYSGGLGILAGDHCKTASDLGVPFVGVGLFYMKGYFDQRLRADGWQEDSDDHVEVALTPLLELRGPKGEPYLTVVETFGRAVHVQVWTMKVGRIPIYLLDTNLEDNHPDDRTLLSKLYAGGPDLRLRQEWLLGVGGVRVLRAVGVNPGVWHANEGHAAFMLIERLRELTVAGQSFEAAVKEVRATSVFTTHTPVPAGHDAFDVEQLAQCTGPIWEEMGIERDTLFDVGLFGGNGDDRFQMTVTAARLSGRINGVSERHGQVSRQIWNDLWPDRAEDDVPIGAITNGVHLATWMANPIMALLDRSLGIDWGYRLDDPSILDRIFELDDAAVWGAHKYLKRALLDFCREQARLRWTEVGTDVAQLVGAGTLLSPEPLTIGFARRFASYKRASLMFRDSDRLHRLLCDKRRPVQIIFAGKAHPADNPGKQILQQVYQSTHDRFFEGRVAFLEDYDMHVAAALVQGVDVWLNLPRVPMEACGTSGMKAAFNAVPQMGTIDGWWEEGYDGTNGWAIPFAHHGDDPEAADTSDAEHFYRLIEEELVPLYYTRTADGVPLGWVDKMRNALRVAFQKFNARRMVQVYAERYYVPSMRRDPFPDDPPTG